MQLSWSDLFKGHPASNGESEIQTQGCLTPELIPVPLGHLSSSSFFFLACSMQDINSQPGIEPLTPTMEAES